MLSSKTFQFVVGILLLELLKFYCLCTATVWFLFLGISDNEAAIQECRWPLGWWVCRCVHPQFLSFCIPLCYLLG